LIQRKKEVDPGWYEKRMKMIGDQMGRNKEDDEVISIWYTYFE
jgi:hypothetical protein